jgi:uncharacterized repeat protein (TIGR03803 family)
MNTKHLTIIVASGWLGCLAPLLASAQPVITTQPTNHFMNASGTVTFSVGISGTSTTPFAYQWLFDGTAITGATNRTLPLPNPQPAQWGYYSVIVSNASGSVTSQVAELRVFVAAPHSLSGIRAEADGSKSLSFAGETTAAFAPYYDLYPLESSSDLVTWAPLATLQRASSALDTLCFVDTNTAGFRQRFYRTPTNQLATPVNQTTGPYSVGTFSMVMTDPSRTNAVGKTNYQFMTTFWYPAVAQAGVLPAKYVESQVALSGYYDYTGSGGENFGGQAAAFFSHSLSNAPIKADLPKYPVVLYDPATGGHRRDSTDKAEDLASWGYVVVGLDTSDTSVSVFPNGTVVHGQYPIANTTQADDADLEGRLRDLQFVLDQLAILNAGDARLGGRLDLDEIGVFGWSRGGGPSEVLCLRDPRCKAGVGWDPYSSDTDLLTRPLNVPYLFLRSGWGPDPDPGNIEFVIGDRAEFRREVYNQQVTNAYWVKLVSTTHTAFCDDALILDPASLVSASSTPMSGQVLPPARLSQILRAYLLSFFNKFLKGQDDHLLDGPPAAYPEVMQFLSTSSVSVPPEYPSSALVQGRDGNFYGTTAYGGKSQDGTVFRVTTNGVWTILVSFAGTNGSHPLAALVQGSDGNFYGTTEDGGTNGNSGTVFQMTPAGALTALVSFNSTNGSHPTAGLVQGGDGNLYGTTILGGSNNLGTVFQVTTNGMLTTLVSFNRANGSGPFGALVQGGDGNFYGTTAGGGAVGGGGTVFKMTPAGGLTTLFSFNETDGANPSAALVQGTNGIFYGTAEYTGISGGETGMGFGRVFKMTSAGMRTSLVRFAGINGSYCISSLLQGVDGNFYGTTAGGGPGGGGTVFKMTPAGGLTTLFSFNGANGHSPQAPLVQGSDGNFYGTTTYGGPGGGGTVFQITPAGVLTTLVAFGSQTNSP